MENCLTGPSGCCSQTKPERVSRVEILEASNGYLVNAYGEKSFVFINIDDAFAFAKTKIGSLKI